MPLTQLILKKWLKILGRTEVVKFNKVMTDLTGMTFDQATANAAANLAKQENVATGKVLKDISTSA